MIFHGATVALVENWIETVPSGQFNVKLKYFSSIYCELFNKQLLNRIYFKGMVCNCGCFPKYTIAETS